MKDGLWLQVVLLIFGITLLVMGLTGRAQAIWKESTK